MNRLLAHFLESRTDDESKYLAGIVIRTRMAASGTGNQLLFFTTKKKTKKQKVLTVVLHPRILMLEESENELAYLKLFLQKHKLY